MSKKSLSYFMKPDQSEVVTVPGPESFKDEEGNVIQFEIKVLSQEKINEINANYRRRSIATDKKGNPLVANGEAVWKTERDSARASRHMIVEALQYPNLQDPELMEYYHCVDMTDMPLKVFQRTDDYQYVVNIVMKALGMIADAEDGDIDDAKN